MEDNTVTNEMLEAKTARANNVVAAINQTKPVTDWHFTASVWWSRDARLARVYVNDKKRNAAAIITINDDLSLTPQWQAGHSLTRNALRPIIEAL